MNKLFGVKPLRITTDYTLGDILREFDVSKFPRELLITPYKRDYVVGCLSTISFMNAMHDGVDLSQKVGDLTYYHSKPIAAKLCEPYETQEQKAIEASRGIRSLFLNLTGTPSGSFKEFYKEITWLEVLNLT